MNNGKENILHLKHPPELKPHVKFSHPENYSRTVGDMAKGAYCHQLDVLLDCLKHAEAQLRQIREGVLEVREEKFSKVPVDWELSIMHEMKRILHCAAVLQFLHNLNVNTGPRPTESRHMRNLKRNQKGSNEPY